MMPTGIIRRVDDLGRIAIPKEIRVSLGIEEDTPIEIMVDKEGNIALKKHIDTEKEISLEEAVKKIQETLDSPELKSEVPEDILMNMKDYWDMIKEQFWVRGSFNYV